MPDTVAADGRGNPNWIATAPRDAFFLLGRFAITACRQAGDEGLLAALPRREKIARGFLRFLDAMRGVPGEPQLRALFAHGVQELGFDADAFVHELADGVLGDRYPAGRMLAHAERIVHAWLLRELCAGQPPAGRFDLFAVEGSTAAMTYVFDSLLHNGLLARGDAVAVLQPIPPAYAEMAALERFNFELVRLNPSPTRTDGTYAWHYPEAELARLADPRIRLLLCVNPATPTSLALAPRERHAIARAVAGSNPDLVIVTDDVYGTFVPGFRSLMADLPANVIGVYSFSKCFGCTGWRLGVVALHEDNVLDRRLARHGAGWKQALERRYGSITREPSGLKFIDRMAADSRQVALHATAGLSTPQQVQMALFALADLAGRGDAYRQAGSCVLRRRRDLLWSGLGLPLPQEDAERAWYQAEIDLEMWMRRTHGNDFFHYLSAHHGSADFLLRLAERSAIVLHDGASRGGPPWSVHIPLAALEDDDCASIGVHVRAVAREYVHQWQASGK